MPSPKLSTAPRASASRIAASLGHAHQFSYDSPEAVFEELRRATAGGSQGVEIG